jgi:hypothetical protein
MLTPRTVEVVQMPDEHDDDLEAEVIEGAEIETEEYERAEEEDIAQATHVTDSAGRADESKIPPDGEEEEGEPSDSM